MTWTDEDEREFQMRRAEHFAEEQREDDELARRVRLGISPACPNCGSHRYIESTKTESCDNCGHGESYW